MPLPASGHTSDVQGTPTMAGKAAKFTVRFHVVQGISMASQAKFPEHRWIFRSSALCCPDRLHLKPTGCITCPSQEKEPQHFSTLKGACCVLVQAAVTGVCTCPKLPLHIPLHAGWVCTCLNH